MNAAALVQASPSPCSPVIGSGTNMVRDAARESDVPLASALLARWAAAFEVEAVLQTGSTNLDLVMRCRQARPTRPLLRAALLQTAGRGRHGRRWHASAGKALLFSLAIPMSTADAQIAAATLACGVGAAEALRDMGAAVQIKWPNDLMLSERKLGGVLCELAMDDQGRRSLVVGVGVNIGLDASMQGSIGQPAAALDEVLPLAAVRREELIGRMATAILEALREFEAHGFMPLQARFMSLFAHRDVVVDLIEIGVRVATGRALGVDGEGRLLLATECGVRACSTGEVSLRLSR